MNAVTVIRPESPFTDYPYREGWYRGMDGARLYYRDYGPRQGGKTPLLCLTGLTRNSADYHEFASKLADGRRIICPDYRGRGKSQREDDWRKYSGPRIAGDISALVTALNLHRIVCIGTSMGGILSMGLNALRPGLVAGAVLNDVGPDVSQGSAARIAASIGTDRPQKDWPAAIEFCRSHYTQLKRFDDHDWEAMAHATFAQDDDGMLHFNWDTALAKTLSQDRSKSGIDLWSLYRGLRAKPVLVLRGALSDVLRPDTFDKMGEDMPHVKRIEIPNIGHVPALHWDDCLSPIKALLAKIDA